jgi:YidC/Oxa1 family membrane protein insertase
MSAPHSPNDIEDHNRVMVAVGLSLLILFAWHFFAPKPPVPAPQDKKAAAVIEAARRPRAEVLGESRRIPIRGAKVTGSVSLKGLRLDDLLLNGQYVTVEKKDLVPLFTPSGVEGAFWAESGWLSDKKDVAVPTQDTVWTPAPGSPSEITSGGAPVTLRWDNGQGVTFERAIALDDAYLFTVTQRVINHTASPLTLNAYHMTARNGLPPDFKGFYVLHEGPVGFFGGKGQDEQYKNLVKGDVIEVADTHGWLGITDKYWMAAVLPEPQQSFSAHVAATPGKVPHFQSDLVDAAQTVAPGGAAENRTYVYAGIKTLDLMKAYEAKYGFERLDLGIDFGIWYFITKPFYYLFHLLVKLIGNVGLSILAMTVIVRGAMFPLATKAYTSMAKMKKIGPEMKALQEKYKDDKTQLQMEIFELYKREDTNPFSGCWPMLVQVPVFFALYKVILISIELRHAPFPGWIRDLSAPDPTTVFNLFGLIPWQPPQGLMIGAWPLLFCATMVIQKRLSPPLPDAMQEKMQSYFPFFITFMMAHFAAGLVIYWTWSNTLAIFQQYYISKKVGGEEVSILRGHHARRKPKAKKK